MPVAILVHGDRSRMVSSPSSWEDLVTKIKRFLSVDDLDEDKLILVIHPDWSDAPLELDSSALFDFRLPDKSRITITLDTYGDTADEDDDEDDEDYECDECDDDDDSDEDIDSNAEVRTASQPFDVVVKTLTGKTWLAFPVRSDMTVPEFKEEFWRREGIPVDQLRVISKGVQFEDRCKLSDYRIEKGDIIWIVLKMRGAKPAIYLLTPEDVSGLQVALHLSDDWQLTVLYPAINAIEVSRSKFSHTWYVDVETSGIMFDYATTMDTSCLFWEAESVMPKSGTVIDRGTFTPNTPNLTPARSRLIERNDLVPYLYESLEALCLTPSMRTDFITFWLPKFYELYTTNFDIVLNFVEQAKYDKAASLTFSQPPDAMVRVFMVFGGVLRDTEEHAAWMANQGGPETPEGWRYVVGISKEVLDIMADETKFRVVEWGGMHAFPSM